MKRLLPLLIAGTAFAVEPEALYDFDLEGDGHYEVMWKDWVYDPAQEEWNRVYYYIAEDGTRTDVPSPWVQWEADMDGAGALDRVCRDPDRHDGWFYIGDAGEPVEMLLPWPVKPTPTTRKLYSDNPFPAVRCLKEGSPLWFVHTQGGHWGEIRPDNPYDEDKDDLNTYAEAELGTTPWLADTDGDTLPDGWEVAHGRNPLVADRGYYDELRSRAFPGGEPSMTISRDRSVTVTGLYPVEGLTIVVQVSEDLETWRDGGTAEDAVSGVLEFTSPLPGGFVRLMVREEQP